VPEVSDQTSYFKISDLNQVSFQKIASDLAVSKQPSSVQKSSPRREEVQLESDFIDLAQLQSDPNFKEKAFPGSLYCGLIVDGKREGLGVMRYLNGRQYEGPWLNDKRHGRGFEKFSQGNSYCG
jgi:hypothetical protein